jgi:hypothetical protein
MSTDRKIKRTVITHEPSIGCPEDGLSVGDRLPPSRFGERPTSRAVESLLPYLIA